MSRTCINCGKESLLESRVEVVTDPFYGNFMSNGNNSFAVKFEFVCMNCGANISMSAVKTYSSISELFSKEFTNASKA